MNEEKAGERRHEAGRGRVEHGLHEFSRSDTNQEKGGGV